MGISAACVVGAVLGAIPAHAAMIGDDLGTSTSWAAEGSVPAPDAGSARGTFVIAKLVSKTFTGSGPTAAAATSMALANMGTNCTEETVVVLFNMTTLQYDATVYAGCTEPDDDTCPAKQQPAKGGGVNGRCPS